MRLRTRPVLALASTAFLVLAAGCADETPHTPGSTGSDAGTPSQAPGDDDGAMTSGGGLPTGGLGGGIGGGDGEDSTDDGEEASGPASITIGAAGDLLSHAPVIANAQANAGGDGYDFGPMFDDVRDLLTAPDLTICHMETPLSADNTNITQPRVLVFNTPHELADAVVDAGYDGCDFASNHTWDQGLSGLESTQEVLRGVGLEYAGPTAEEDDPGIAHYEVDGVKVAQLAYSYTIYNSGAPTTDVPPEAPWLGDHLWPLIGAEGILEDAEQAKADGADFVVLSMHWGNEYWTDPTDEQRQLAADLLESDAVDLILGTHVHVIQPCEKINDKYVIYGLGNFLSNQSPDTTGGQLRPETQEGMFAEFDLERDEDGTVTSTMRFQPTRVDLDGHVIRLATPEQHAETYDRVVDTMHLLGDDACDAEPMS
ncbi:CapA family protein [Ornithinicoccus hortensis]|uniref:Poly-gamma-glutamate synthesis protein (Capsule biosynthesis protein) n=1 Tax=Ornithinicoccus hortensis TaxID=82346 RepID=A0A542YRS3_9MICO|nr:CapA family protein [Ornithinicoccus hortensis]TQL50803.1 poly-gamma-glutamate synthesis protein (capsule biosynthesis protein) [Ornithinicoccus hortensis]